jgi:hypothetical protein
MSKTNYKWIRVSKQNPCVVCGRTDWDTYCPELKLACCMRVESTRLAKNGGWLHPMGECPSRPVRKEPDTPVLNVQQRLSNWSEFKRDITWLAERLGVSPNALAYLQCIKSPYYATWAFPMRTGDNDYCGIRLRNSVTGEKWSILGSHNGLFIPQTEPQKTLMILEGPTDTAAALSLGYYAVGRPSCCGGVDHLQTFVKKRNIRRAIIVADLDDPGLRGAKGLQEFLPIPSCILLCPAKDLRTFTNAGGTREMVDAMIEQLIWRKP